jgi:cytochrome P450
VPFFERCRARFGRRFTVRLLGQPPFVMVSEPGEIKEVFTAPPDVLHPGEGARILKPVVGEHSVILLDERPHLEQRKLLLPAFHGEKMQALSGLVREVAERDVQGWPRGEVLELHPRFQALTLEIILRAVFGLDPGERLDAMRSRLTRMATLASQGSAMLPELQGRFNPRYVEFERLRRETDALLFELIAERRADHAERDDVLALLLDARHDDGSPMTQQELRDELMTMLVAGHETTASELSWCFERLVREPRVLRTLTDELDRDDADDAYLTATVQETLRRRPVLPQAAPRLIMREVTIGGWDYPPGACLAANAYLLHHDPAVYDDPYAFRPERFLDEPPGTYTWIPFGGGRRRCLGASFAQLEMKIVLRALLERHAVSAASGGLELSRRRNITLAPSGGARVRLATATAGR